MSYHTLISPEKLAELIAGDGPIVVDCRFDLSDTGAGERAFSESHIPGAQYAHLDRDLSAPIIPGVTGRHPLPSPERATEVFSRMGISAGRQVVAYDGSGGVFAGRLWWMLKWLGHDQVAVLDGGWQSWREGGLPVETERQDAGTGRFIPEPRHEMVVSVEELSDTRTRERYRLVDARDIDRFLGKTEPLDPVAGHIPGAVCLPHAGNLDERQQFLPVDRLRRRYGDLVAGSSAQDLVFYCGSGVSAAHNILAMAHAGLGLPKLYPGSWSEWICDSERPVATGDE